MIAEFRAAQIDLDARRHFTPEKQAVVETRHMIEEALASTAGPSPALRSASTASSFKTAADVGFVEVG